MTDSYEPTGPDGIAMQKLRRMVSASAALQARSGLTETELFDRCSYSVNDDLDEKPRPMYVICVPPGGSRQMQVAGGAQNFLLPSGTLILFIEVDPDPDMVTSNDKAIESHDFFALVMKDVAALAAADDPGQAESYLDITRLTMVDNWESPKSTQPSTGVFYGARIDVEWGIA